MLFKKIILIGSIFFILAHNAFSQIINGTDTLYGNEWLHDNQTYLRLNINTDGIYRIPASVLSSSGVPLSIVKGSQFRLYKMGQEVPIYTSSPIEFTTSGFIEFYGTKHKSDLDKYMFRGNTQGILNPDFSIINDTMSYFLTWVTDTGNGKRIENKINNLTNAPVKEAWFWHKDRRTYNQQDIQHRYGDIYISDFSKGEGYGSAWATDFKLSITPLFRVNTEGGALNIQWANQQYHIGILSLNSTPISNDTISSFTLTEKNILLNVSQMKPAMDIALSGKYSNTDRVAVGVVELTYARQFNFSNSTYFEFNIAASDTAKYLEIDNFNTGGVAPILYDITNNIRIVTTLQTAKVKAVIPPSAQARRFVLVNANSGVKTINTLNKVAFKNFKNENADYIIITSDKFINDGIANEYAQYRQSVAGGSFKTLVVNIEDLYDHFAYGIQRHPMAIRDFTHFIKKNWTNPKFIVLMGKAREFNTIRSAAQLNAQIATYDVPTWGYPGSDILMVSSNTSDKPVIPIGRIAASSPTDVRVYLEKIKDLETAQKNAPQTIQERDFFKNILHLSGGGSVGVPIKQQLKSFEATLSGGKFGASVSTFYKNSVDPVEVAQNDKIFDRINKGLSLITFFGHSATSVLEFDVNNPNLLNNKAKTPVFIALGCSAGNVHQASVGVSENFIFYPNKGMSAFVGTSGTSYLSSLSNFGNNFYDLIANTGYGLELGNIVQKAIEKTSENFALDVRAIIQAFTINGDPAIKIANAPGPDFIINASTVRINPALVTAQSDSIQVMFDLVNIGTAIKDTIKIVFKQQLPDGSIADLISAQVTTPQYRSSLDIRVPLVQKSAVGVNRLHITIDADNKVFEIPAPAGEFNNDLVDPSGKKGFEFLVLANNVLPAYPANLSIIGKSPITLKASTSNPLAQAQNYLFEIDTTQLFNSPLKQQTTLNQKGGVLKWQPTLAWQDSMVYYWRAAVESPTGTHNWQYSSFTYIIGKSGWSQGHYFQFLENKFVDMKVNEGTREVEYVKDDLVVQLRGNASEPLRYPALTFNSVTTTSFNPAKVLELPSCFLITVFDFDLTSFVGGAWNRKEGYKYGIELPTNFNNYVYFTFDANSNDSEKGRLGAINFIKNTIPDGKYVLFYLTTPSGSSRHQGNIWLRDSSSNNENIFQVLEKQGAKAFRNIIMKDSVHYIFVFQKNKSNVIKEVLLNAYSEGINETFSVPRHWYTGTQTTQHVGASKKWDNLTLSYTTGLGDTLGVDIIGISENKVETTLKKNITASTSLSDIEASKYPYLKLKYQSRDIRQQTPPQLNSWRIYYQGLPDLAVNPIVNYSKYKDTIQQGDKFAMSVGVENISDYDADSVAVALILKNAQNQEISLQKKIQPIASGGIAIAPFNYDTKSLDGSQQVFFEINPKQAQSESFTANNFLQTQFAIQQDKTNPLLDVTFDGIRILNNDIVSNRPKIAIQLRDDNKFLALSDTALFKLFIEPLLPSATIRNISFSEPSVRFIPAAINTQGENKAVVEFNPDFLKDGSYRLVVSARDASGNQSGNVNYSIQFKVITKQSISHILPYPNPFSTSTRFAYTLTGDTPPQYMTIQIMTVSGKVVREITQNELGSLRIGTHLTDYAWDGKDDFGSPLANGVYLYRVITKDRNKQKIDRYENSDSNLDLYFKKDFGKIVIMR